MTIGFAMCGSFCTFSQVFPVMEQLAQKYQIVPIFSAQSCAVDSRFGTAESHIARATEICGRKPVCTKPHITTNNAPMSITVEEEKLPNTALAGITPLTNSRAIPPKNTKSEGNLVNICNRNTNKTTKTTNHAATLRPRIIFLSLNSFL
jgi:hypothetical protein